MGKPLSHAEGEVDFAADIIEYYADNFETITADQPIRHSWRGHGRDSPLAARPAAGHHAVELPLLPGGTLRGAQPGCGQHDHPQARAAVPGVVRRDAADVPRRRLPRGRLRQRVRHQRPGGGDHRRPSRGRRLGDRLRARGRRGGRARGRKPQEGGARDGRLRPVHPAVDRRPRRRGRGRRRGAPRQLRAELQRAKALHRDRLSLRRVRGEVHGEHERPGGRRRRSPRTPRLARCRRSRRPSGSRTRSTARWRRARRS